MRSNWSIVSFKACVSLLSFCLVDLSTGVSGVLKSPTIIMLISPFYCGAPMLGAYLFIIVISSSWIDPLTITHSSTLAWKIPWTEEPGRLQSMGSLRVVHD